MKHDPISTAHAAGATTAIVYVVCRFLVGLFPDGMFNLAQSWLHGIELQRLSSWNPTTGNFLLGLITASVFAWLTGYLFANLYNLLLGKK
jgi:hypothetical protein